MVVDGGGSLGFFVWLAADKCDDGAGGCGSVCGTFFLLAASFVVACNRSNLRARALYLISIPSLIDIFLSEGEGLSE